LAAQSSGRCVVIVEDDASLLSSQVFALEAEGFHVRAFSRGLALIANPVGADCLVVDMRLPDTDGLRLIARLREAGIDAPAILMTTNPDARVRRAALAGDISIVEKPLITEELRRRIDTLIAARNG
jgi:two-component system response regulator FixJ